MFEDSPDGGSSCEGYVSDFSIITLGLPKNLFVVFLPQDLGHGPWAQPGVAVGRPGHCPSTVTRALGASISGASMKHICRSH